MVERGDHAGSLALVAGRARHASPASRAAPPLGWGNADVRAIGMQWSRGRDAQLRPGRVDRVPRDRRRSVGSRARRPLRAPHRQARCMPRQWHPRRPPRHGGPQRQRRRRARSESEPVSEAAPAAPLKKLRVVKDTGARAKPTRAKKPRTAPLSEVGGARSRRCSTRRPIRPRQFRRGAKKPRPPNRLDAALRHRGRARRRARRRRRRCCGARSAAAEPHARRAAQLSSEVACVRVGASRPRRSAARTRRAAGSRRRGCTARAAAASSCPEG